MKLGLLYFDTETNEAVSPPEPKTKIEKLAWQLARLADMYIPHKDFLWFFQDYAALCNDYGVDIFKLYLFRNPLKKEISKLKPFQIPYTPEVYEKIIKFKKVKGKYNLFVVRYLLLCEMHLGYNYNEFSGRLNNIATTFGIDVFRIYYPEKFRNLFQKALIDIPKEKKLQD